MDLITLLLVLAGVITLAVIVSPTARKWVLRQLGFIKHDLSSLIGDLEEKIKHLNDHAEDLKLQAIDQAAQAAELQAQADRKNADAFRATIIATNVKTLVAAPD